MPVLLELPVTEAVATLLLSANAFEHDVHCPLHADGEFELRIAVTKTAAHRANIAKAANKKALCLFMISAQ